MPLLVPKAPGVLSPARTCPAVHYACPADHEGGTDAGQRRTHPPLIAIGDTNGLTSYCKRQRESNPLSGSLISCTASQAVSFQ
jgi:hypothetical protein